MDPHPVYYCYSSMIIVLQCVCCVLLYVVLRRFECVDGNQRLSSLAFSHPRSPFPHPLSPSSFHSVPLRVPRSTGIYMAAAAGELVNRINAAAVRALQRRLADRATDRNTANTADTADTLVCTTSADTDNTDSGQGSDTGSTRTSTQSSSSSGMGAAAAGATVKVTVVEGSTAFLGLEDVAEGILQDPELLDTMSRLGCNELIFNAGCLRMP